MKTAVIVLLIAVICIQCELSLGGRSKNKSQRKAMAKKPSIVQPTENIQDEPAATTASTASTAPTAPAATAAVANSPVTASDNDYPEVTIIKGEKDGTITVEGQVVESNDTELRKGIVKLNIGRGYIVINNAVILDRKPVKPDRNYTKFSTDQVNNFEIKVMKNGRVEYTDDGFEEGELMSGQMY